MFSKSHSKDRAAVKKHDIETWRQLFESKRKRDGAGTGEPPSKYLALDDSSENDNEEASNEEDNIVEFSSQQSEEKDLDVKPKSENLNEAEVQQVQHEPAIVDEDDGSSTSFDSEEDGCSSPKQILPASQEGRELKILEFPTPVKTSAPRRLENEDDEYDHDDEDSDGFSPPLSPVVQPNRNDGGDSDIKEYLSPVKIVPERSNRAGASDDDESEIQAKCSSSSDEDADDNVETFPTQGPSQKRRTKKKPVAIATMPVINVQDAVTLSLVVVRCSSMGDGNGTLQGPLVWCLCFDMLYDCQRYVVFIEKDNKKIRPGMCIRLYSPWLVSSLSNVAHEVIHSADMYQIIVPSMVSMSSERIRDVITSMSNVVDYSSFRRSIPGNSLSDVLTVLPQLKYHYNTIRKQVASYRPNFTIDAMVWMVYELPDTVQVIVQDCDFVFILIEAKKETGFIVPKPGSFYRFDRLLKCGRVNQHTYAPLFSVIKSLGSHQDTYYRLTWIMNSTIEKFEHTSPYCPLPPPEIKHISLSLQDVQSVHMEGRRVSTRAEIAFVSKSELHLVDGDLKVRILLLDSFNRKKLLTPQDVGKIAEIQFLRLSDNSIGNCSLDQYSLVSVKSAQAAGNVTET